MITWFGGSAMTTLFLDTADGASVDMVVPMGHQFLIINAAFAIPLLFVNLLRFTIQGLGYSGLRCSRECSRWSPEAPSGFVWCRCWGIRRRALPALRHG